MIDDEASIAKDIYIHHFDDNVDYPDVLKAIIVGIQKGAEFKERKIEELEAENEANKNGAEKYAELYFETNDKLNNAKAIIRDLLRVTYGEGWNHSLGVKAMAEQFLKEV